MYVSCFSQQVSKFITDPLHNTWIQWDISHRVRKSIYKPPRDLPELQFLRLKPFYRLDILVQSAAQYIAMTANQSSNKLKQDRVYITGQVTRMQNKVKPVWSNHSKRGKNRFSSYWRPLFCLVLSGRLIKVWVYVLKFTCSRFYSVVCIGGRLVPRSDFVLGLKVSVKMLTKTKNQESTWPTDAFLSFFMPSWFPPKQLGIWIVGPPLTLKGV